jgi:hypothetical protein
MREETMEAFMSVYAKGKERSWSRGTLLREMSFPLWDILMQRRRV